MNSRTILKISLWRKYGCEARYWEREQEMEPHICYGGRTLHEFLYLKNDMPVAKQEYLDSELNCSPLCQQAHMRLQYSAEFRAWLARRRIAEFGELAVRVYLAGAPLKIKTTLEQVLIVKLPAYTAEEHNTYIRQKMEEKCPGGQNEQMPTNKKSSTLS